MSKQQLTAVTGGLVVVAALALAMFATAERGAAQSTTTIWSATLTVDTDASEDYFGCDEHDSSQDNCSSALTDDDFDYKGTTYTIFQVYWLRSGSKLILQTDSEQAPLSALTLNVDGTPFRLSDTDIHNLDWSFNPSPE